MTSPILTPELRQKLRHAARIARNRRHRRPDPLCPVCNGSGQWESGSGRVRIAGGEAYEDLHIHGRPGRPCPLCWHRPAGPRPDRARLAEEIARRERRQAEAQALADELATFGAHKGGLK